MRTVAKIMYEVTDHKNVGLDIFNDRATSMIAKNTENLDAFVGFLNEF